MTSIYILYVHDKSIKSPVTFPELQFINPLIYPLLWIGTTTCVNISNVIYDKRSTFTKFKNQKRYYIEYMDLFKYLDTHAFNSDLTIEIKSLETNIPSVELVNSRLAHYLTNYRLFYGSNLILNKEYRVFLTDTSKRFETVVPDREKYDESVPSDERKKQSFKKYSDKFREKINAKSRRYYESHKAELKAKRDAKKTNTAQPETNIEPAALASSAD